MRIFPIVLPCLLLLFIVLNLTTFVATDMVQIWQTGRYRETMEKTPEDCPG